MSLAFGLRDGLPADGRPMWGARLIFPADLIWDRQDIDGEDTDELRGWLNGGALNSALNNARLLADEGQLRRDSEATYVLHRDERGVIKGSPQRSCGYLYVAAWLTSDVDAGVDDSVS